MSNGLNTCFFSSPKQEIFLHNHSAVIKIRELTLPQYCYLISGLHWNFVFYPIYSKVLNLRLCCVEFSYWISLIWTCFWVFFKGVIGIFEESKPVFVEWPQFSLVWYFLKIMLSPLSRITPDVVVNSHCVASGNVCCWLGVFRRWVILSWFSISLLIPSNR